MFDCLPATATTGRVGFLSSPRPRYATGMLYAFDVLMSAGDDLRPLPLHLRKNHLAKMLRWRFDGIILNDFEQGEIGPDLFRHACLMGLEGIVSKQ